MSSSKSNAPLIAVLGATGHQGGGVVRALHASGKFRIRALTRSAGKRVDMANEVVAADLNRPETLTAAFEGAHGVFAVTNAWDAGGADELAQGRAAVNAAKEAGVDHFVWSTLPNVEAISGGKYDVRHFTDKAKVDDIVKGAGFRHSTFVIASFFYQNLTGHTAPKPQRDGSLGWALPIDPAAPIHMGDVTELGRIVAGAFSAPEIAGRGQYLPLVGDLLSFDQVVATLNRQGHAYTFNRIPPEVYAGFFPGARELAEMMGYFEEYTYLGHDSRDQIALAKQVAGKSPTDFATWASSNMPIESDASAAGRVA